MAEPIHSQEDAHALSEDERALARVGRTIKTKWTLDELLGVGGMAAVYAASHRNGQRAALKILHTDYARDKIVCERFLREAYVSNKVNHPACVKIVDDDMTDDDEPFLVMELLEGETVRDAWKATGRVMPVARVLAIADRVLDCLSACHAIGVIHRDLKPANIFLTKAGEVKVLDFGVAQMRSATAERTAAGTALGTPAYMSPEQAMGLVDQLDGRADLFSVGAMMHALMTGQRLNNGRTEQEALVMAATIPAPSVARIAPHLPIEVIALIDKALAWDRRNRYADAREMQAAVNDAKARVSASHARSGESPRARMASGLNLEKAALEKEKLDKRAIDQGALDKTGFDRGPLAEKREAQVAPTRGRMPVAQVAPVASHAAAEEEPQIPENDPRVEKMRDLFRQVDRVLPNVRQFGWEHPATERVLRTAFEAFAQMLAKDVGRERAIDLAVRPYSFLSYGHVVWEPGPPFDAVPYNMFACGMRALRLEAGLTMDELRAVLSLILLDPVRELPPEDDLATAFWERDLPHVKYDVVDAFAEGDAAEREAFYDAADALEEMAAEAARRANAVEAKAMAVSTDRAALRDGRAASPMALDDVVRAVFATQLDVSREKWSERYVDALIEGYLDAATNRDAPLVLASLRRSAADLVVTRRLRVIISMHDALIETLSHRVVGEDFARLSAALTNALFGAETLELILKYLQETPADVGIFEPVLSSLWAAELPTALSALSAAGPGPLRDMLHRYVERVLPGHEVDVAAAIAGLDPEVAVALVRVLGGAGTAEAKRALAQLASSDDVTVRIEAKVVLASSADQVHGELIGMLENASALVRMAAQRAIQRHALKQAWPAIARQVRAPNFHELGSDERRELLRTLIALSPERGEPIALELLKKGGVFSSEDRETSRVLAAEALGAFSKSQLTAAALREVAQTRWGTSDETRTAASVAAKQIATREGAA